ncbi:MAG: hypothetical protein WA896_13260, partial [Spirulinaceae cyanobacterium]
LVSAKTSGSGQAGILNVDAAESVQIAGISGNGQNRSELLFDSSGTGDAGELTVNTSQLFIQDGGQVSATTSSLGLGGTLDVDAADSTVISGTNGQFNSRLIFESNGAGDARGITLNTGDLTVENGGQITVGGTGAGESGNLDITANRIFLANQGQLQATTQAVRGGNIGLQVRDYILMRFGSEISAEAFGVSDGGNIFLLDTPFVIAILSENSDVVAGAELGQGGAIFAPNTKASFFREFNGFRTPESDFTADSQIPGLEGVVDAQRLDQTTEPFPEDFQEQEVTQACQAGQNSENRGRSTFINRGRGGLPPQPNAPLGGSSIEIELNNFPQREEQSEVEDEDATNKIKNPVVVTENNEFGCGLEFHSYP